MIVVSDTSCISNLLSIGREELLPRLFGEVLIPPAVLRELLRFHEQVPGFVRCVAPTRIGELARLSQKLDLGEAEAICLALELKADRLLIDEAPGRAAALREGIPIIGLVGVRFPLTQYLKDALETAKTLRFGLSIKPTLVIPSVPVDERKTTVS